MEQARRADAHSFAELDKFLITHVHLDLNVSFNRRELDGAATLSIARVSEAAERLVLDTRDLIIHLAEGSPDARRFAVRRHEFLPADHLLGSPLVVHLDSADRFVRIAYSTSAGATALQWLAPSQTASGRFPYLFTQSQEIHARSWMPVQDTPSVRVTFSARIRTPEQLVAIMGADHEPSSRRTGVYEFSMTQPIPPYLIALAVGDIEFRSTGERTGVYAEPTVLEQAVREFGDTERMLRAVEGLYGPYLWTRFDLLVLPPSFPFGGMEIPKLTFVTPTLIAGDKSLVSLIAHEMAHAWSGNLVTNATWSDFWLNEGFTTYIEHRIIELVYGRRRAEIEEVLQRRALEEEMAHLPARDQVLQMNLAGRDPDNGATLVPYAKGALFLRSIEEHVGRERFDRFLRGYFDHFAFRSVTTVQVIQYMKETLLKEDPDPSASLHIREWISQPGLPASAPAARSEALTAVEQSAAGWLGKATPPPPVNFAGWSAQETLHFLNSVPLDIGRDRLAWLDEEGQFTASSNSEILYRWLRMAVRNHYEPAYGALEHFLRTVGRRKYVKPLYEDLMKSPERRRWAESLYADVRSRYHPITQAAIDEILSSGVPQ